MAAAFAEIFFAGNVFKVAELGMEVGMNEGRRHGGILGGQGRRSQTKLGSLVVTTNLNGQALIPLDIYLVGFYMGCAVRLSKYQHL
jgi:hypothetical protein